MNISVRFCAVDYIGFWPLNDKYQGSDISVNHNNAILSIIIHTELLVAKIKSCILKLCDKEGNIFLILPGQYFFNTARTLCDQSFPRIALCPAHLSYCCYVPQAFAFVR